MRQSGVALSLFLVVAVWFWPGLSGGFWLDDMGNLPPLFELLRTEGFWYSVTSNTSGPLGRPVSIFTFALQASDWPSPRSFILVNIIIHCANAVLVFLLVRLVLRHLTLLSPNRLVICSLAVALVWALAPIQVSTVLYVVQRMVLLSSFFVLLALLAVYYGWREYSEGRPARGFFAIFILGGLLGLVGLLAKESAFLLVVYMLCLKYVFDVTCQPSYFSYRVLLPVFLWAAFASLSAYLIYGSFGGFDVSYELRPYNVVERLLTESRVLWAYLGQTLLPKSSSLGLFHDDYLISRDLISPISTLLSVLAWFGVVSLIGAAVYFKKPAIVFVTAWFLGGHVLESTVLPLELYFEHRNYLPSISIWVGVALILLKLHSIFDTVAKKRLLWALSCFWLIGILFVSYSTVNLWGQPTKFKLISASENPTSIRARALKLEVLQLTHGMVAAQSELKNMQQDFPLSLALHLLEVEYACASSDIKLEGFPVKANELASSTNFSHSITASLSQLVELKSQINPCEVFEVDELIELMEALLANPKYTSGHAGLKMLLAKLVWAVGDQDRALEWLASLSGYKYEYDVFEVVLLASSGKPEVALNKLLMLKERAIYMWKVRAQAEYLAKLEFELMSDLKQNQGVM